MVVRTGRSSTFGATSSLCGSVLRSVVVKGDIGLGVSGELAVRWLFRFGLDNVMIGDGKGDLSSSVRMKGGSDKDDGSDVHEFFFCSSCRLHNVSLASTSAISCSFACTSGR